VAGIFFTSGLTLPTDELLNTVTNPRMHALIQGFSFVCVPLLMQLLSLLLAPLLSPGLLLGFQIVACMPPPVSTGEPERVRWLVCVRLIVVAMPCRAAVILTKAAGGNEAAAVFNSALGSFLGLFITPALVALTTGFTPELGVMAMIMNLTVAVVLPLALGQCVRAALAHEPDALPLKEVGQCCLLFIIYTSFCEAVSNAPDPKPAAILKTVLLVVCVQLFFMATAALLAILSGFPRRDVACVVFTAVHKSLTLGMPILMLMVPAEEPRFFELALPLLAYHPIQIMLGSALVPRIAEWVVANAYMPLEIELRTTSHATYMPIDDLESR
jgi:sodium/bile acid cotransporter 7